VGTLIQDCVGRCAGVPKNNVHIQSSHTHSYIPQAFVHLTCKASPQKQPCQLTFVKQGSSGKTALTVQKLNRNKNKNINQNIVFFITQCSILK
jgi:hypothetical protein